MTGHKHDKEKLYCTVCRSIIPDERVLKEAVTCCKGCATTLRNIRRRRRDLKQCRLCNQPSTPEERRLFKQWRKSLPTWKETRGRRKGTKNKPKLEAHPAQAEFTEMIEV